MIICRSPLRVTLGGGGTDLPSYYREHGGFLIAAAIDRYVYVSVMRPFKPGIFLKYSKMEEAERVEDIRHPIIREALALLKLRTPQIEISSMADIPAGTGLGSSGSFVTALLKALHAHRRLALPPGDLAELAVHIELERLREPIGKQDQYISAFGGLTAFSFHPDDSVTVTPLALPIQTLFELEDRLLLFFTGFARRAGAVLRDQEEKSLSGDQAMLDNLHYVKEMGWRARGLLEKGDLFQFGRLMDEHWRHKKKRSEGLSRPEIDACYDLAMENGAVGGKLVGAGGGGFLMFLAEDGARLRRAMAEAGLEEVRFRFDFDGAKTLAA